MRARISSPAAPSGSTSTVRAGVYLDLENLLFSDRERGDLASGIAAIRTYLAELERRATVVTKVAICDRTLATSVALPLATHGIRTFAHPGGVNAADTALIDVIRSDLPASCDLVVIGSGDHIFAPVAGRLRATGRRVEVLAQSGCVAASLYRAVDAHLDLGHFIERTAA